MLARIQSEAGYFDLHALHNECKRVADCANPVRNNNLFTCERTKEIVTPFKYSQIEYPVEIQETSSPLFYDLQRFLAPLSMTGRIDCALDCQDIIVQTSTVTNPQPKELIELAKRSNGATADSNTFILDAVMLNKQQLMKMGKDVLLQRMFPRTKVGVVPSKLVIQTAGSEYQPTMKPDVERNSTYLGTLVAVLNSTFSGGEVTVGIGPEAVTFDVSAMQWFAVHAESAFTTTPVTAGTRITVEYDMYDQQTPVWYSKLRPSYEHPYATVPLVPEVTACTSTIYTGQSKHCPRHR